jgi:endoglycosylceramidase
MWEYVANYFQGNPNVAGYEIMTEPWPGSSWPLIPLGSPAFGAQELTPFFNQVDAAIRAADPSTTVYIEPNLLFESGVSPIKLGTINDPNTVFGFEVYCPVTYLLDSSFGCESYDSAIMDRAESYAKSHDMPMLLEEFGAGDNLGAIAAMEQAADEHQLGWTEWPYSGLGDITTVASSGNGESLVYDPREPPVGDNVFTEKLGILAHPYPQIVAGTPNSWSFDSNTDTFKFSYSTENVDGNGSFPAGSQTTISTPAVEYPNGYQVSSITGGQVVSDPNAPELVIASDGSASTVSVTVTPAAGGAG